MTDPTTPVPSPSDPVDEVSFSAGPPDPFTPPPQRQPGRLLAGCLSFCGLLLVLLVLGGLVLLIIATFRGDGRGLFEEEVSGSAGTRKVVLIELTGIIAETQAGVFSPGVGPVEDVREKLDRAATDEDVAAVVLAIDSPGGTVTASDQLWREVSRFREETGKPVVVHTGALCASGGYYVAVGADKIVCEPTTITGSIGVVLTMLNFHELLDKHGVRDVTITSAPHKDLLSPLAPVDDKDQAILQNVVDQAHQRFVAIVAEGRNMPEARARELADGRIYTAKEAVSLGLADVVGYRDEAERLAHRLAGVDQARLVRYVRPLTLTDLLRGGGQSPLGEARSQLDRLRTPRLLAMWMP